MRAKGTSGELGLEVSDGGGRLDCVCARTVPLIPFEHNARRAKESRVSQLQHGVDAAKPRHAAGPACPPPRDDSFKQRIPSFAKLGRQ